MKFIHLLPSVFKCFPSQRFSLIVTVYFNGCFQNLLRFPSNFLFLHPQRFLAFGFFFFLLIKASEVLIQHLKYRRKHYGQVRYRKLLLLERRCSPSPPPLFRMKVFSDESLQLKFLSRLCSLCNTEQAGAKAKCFLFSLPIFNNTT